MIRRRIQPHPKHGERGVTMVLVVLAMLSMLGIIALAIDVITLYSAKSEAQRVADSAALVAAKMLVDAGVTGDPGNAGLQTSAQGIATTAAKDIGRQSVIAGRPVQATDVTVTFPNGGNSAAFAINPQVSVTVQNTNLPTFFSRIWSRATLTVRATAAAEGFNPSNAGSISGGAGAPVIARCVKPFIIPNCDPIHAGAGCGGTGATFFDPATGTLTNPGAAPGGVIGETFHLYSNCGSGPGCGPLVQGTPNVGIGSGGPTSYYYPAQLPAATNSCPAACGSGTNFENDIACCNPSPISCGTTATLPAVDTLSVDGTVYPDGGGGPAQNGVECLIHQRPGNGMDNLTMPISYPLQIAVGNNHPLAGTVLSANDLVTTSDSLVSIPVYDGAATPGVSAVRIIGFLQVFIVQAFAGGGGPKAGEFQVTVVNVAGCGSNATAAPVTASSAIPVRLIHQ
jgi:Flp pilus assembly protein TadG